MNRRVSLVLVFMVGSLTISHGEVSNNWNKTPSTTVVPKIIENHFQSSELSTNQEKNDKTIEESTHITSKLDLKSEKIKRENESVEENADEKLASKRAASSWSSSWSSRSSSSRTRVPYQTQQVQKPGVQFYHSESSELNGKRLDGNQNADTTTSVSTPAAWQEWMARSSPYAGSYPSWYSYYYGSSDAQYGNGNQESGPTHYSLFRPENYQYSSSYYNRGQNVNAAENAQYIGDAPASDSYGSSTDESETNTSGQLNPQSYYNSAYWYSQARSPYYQPQMWSNNAGSYYGGAVQTSVPQMSYYSQKSTSPYYSYNPSYASSYTSSQSPSYYSSYSSYYSPSYSQSYASPYSSSYTSSQAMTSPQIPWNQQWSTQWQRPSSFWSDNSWHGMQVGCSGASKQCLNAGHLLQPTTGHCYPLGDTRPCAGGGVWALDASALSRGNVQGQCHQPPPCGGQGVRMAYDGRCYGQWTARNVLCARGNVAYHPMGDRECLHSRYLSLAPPRQPQVPGTCVLPRFRQAWATNECSSGACEDDDEIIYDDDCGPDCE